MEEDRYKEHVINTIGDILGDLTLDKFMQAVECWGLDTEEELFNSIMEGVKTIDSPNIVMQFLYDLEGIRDGDC